VAFLFPQSAAHRGYGRQTGDRENATVVFLFAICLTLPIGSYPAQASRRYTEAGFINVRLTSHFTHEPAKAEDAIFCIWGTRP
jgi:hypothetical protein